MRAGEATRRWLRLAAEHVDAGIVVHDPTGTILWANARAATVVGIRHDEIAGVTTTDDRFEFLDDEGEPLALEDYPVVQVLANPDVPYRDREVGAITPDGTRTWARVTATPVFEDDALACVVVTFVDVTRRKAVEEALSRSEQRLAAALEGTSDGIWYRRLPDGATFFSKRFEALLGLEPGALREDVEAFRALLHPEDRARLLMARTGYLGGDLSTFDVEVRARHAGGAWRWYRIRGRARHDAAGRPVEFGGAFQDITERKHAEAMQQVLDQKLAETARLESLALLAGGIAHDFNNILVGVMSATDLALEGDVDGETKALLELSRESASRAAELTRQLLAYAGRAQLAIERVDPCVISKEVVGLARGTVGSSARLVLDVGESCPGVRCDPTQLRQVLLNLLINGAQAVRESGGGAVTVRCRCAHHDEDALEARAPGRALEPGDFVVFEVEDDGVGMTREVLERIFEPFFTTKQTGTGLGLAAVHGVVRSHHGYIHVTSAPGRGTRFELGLPADGASEPAKEAERAPASSRSREDLVALVVDDEPAVRRVLAGALEAEGMAVETMEDGRGLLQRIETRRPDVLFLDANLSGESGLALLDGLRRVDRALPVVLMSGFVDTEARATEAWGNTRFLAKPFLVRDLVGCLDALGLATSS